MSLTAQQYALACHVVRGASVREASTAIGISDSRARSWLASRDVGAEIERLRSAISAHVVITRDRILRGLLAEAESDTNRSSERIAAWRALASMIPGVLAPVEVTHDVRPGLSTEAADLIRAQILGLGSSPVHVLQ